MRLSVTLLLTVVSAASAQTFNPMVISPRVSLPSPASPLPYFSAALSPRWVAAAARAPQAALSALPAPAPTALPGLPAAAAENAPAQSPAPAAKPQKSAGQPAPKRERLDDLFDGRDSVRPGRHVTLPERELEDEIGY